MNVKKILLWTGVLIAIVALYLPGYTRVQELKQEEARMQAEIERLRATTQAYKEEIDRLETDPIYVERVARRDMGLAKEGEIIVEVVEE